MTYLDEAPAHMWEQLFDELGSRPEDARVVRDHTHRLWRVYAGTRPVATLTDEEVREKRARVTWPGGA